MKILPCGDAAVTVEFGNEISPEIGAMVRTFRKNAENSRIKGIIELIPTFRSVTVCYDPTIIKYAKLVKKLTALEPKGDIDAESGGRIFVIPVCYDGEYGADLDSVSQLTGLDREEIIKRHTAPDYQIYMLGFLPGFPYLGGLDKSIACPRLDSPRKEIPVGAVGIGGEQTGIYPLVSPGGWRLIGRTPVKVYDPNRAEPVLYAAGDYIRFKRIDEAEFTRIANDAAYMPEIIERK